MSNEPRAPYSSSIKNLRCANSAVRCGAKSKSTGQPCRQPAMANSRCRLHGGLGAGPLTAKGLEASHKSRWIHGHYSKAARQQRFDARRHLRALVRIMKGHKR
jgi:hypothetical protein